MDVQRFFESFEAARQNIASHRPSDIRLQPPSARDLVKFYHSRFQSSIAGGEVRPFVVPYSFFGLFALIIYLLISHTNRPWLYATRWPLFAWITWFQLKIMLESRSLHMGTGFGVGFISFLLVVLSAKLLVFQDPQRDAKRIERREKSASISGSERLAENGNEDKEIAVGKEQLNGAINTKRRIPYEKPNAQNNESAKVLKQREELTEKSSDSGSAPNGNGHAPEYSKCETRDEIAEEQLAQSLCDQNEYEYFWQSYPEDSLFERISWVCDLVFNFRGPGWNWSIPTIPELPPTILASLNRPLTIKSFTGDSKSGVKRFSTKQALVSSQVPRIIMGYLLLDLLKVTLMKDPHFVLGPEAAAVCDVPPHFTWLSPKVLDLYRILLALVGIVTALESIFILSPLLFCVLLGPSILGVRGEHWMYPTTWGSLSTLLTHGISGFWGLWWHQTFRDVFSAPVKFLVKKKMIDRKSFVTKILGLSFAFGISGALHASGSYTQYAHSRPFNCFLFFVLQAVAVTIQTILSPKLKPLVKKLPEAIQPLLEKLTNLFFAVVWVAGTSPLLVNDLARGGIWLFEPAPLSIIRGLGLGNEGDGWWNLERSWLNPFGILWYTGKHWWESGLVL